MEKYEFEKLNIKALIYGQPGSGKTTLASTAALDSRFGKVLMLEAFGNPIAIRHFKTKPDILTVHNMVDFNAPYEWLSNGQDPNDPFCKEMGLNPPYDTLIIDGLTEVQRFVVRRVTGVDVLAPGDLTPALQRQGFGQLLGTMLNWASHFMKLDMHVILTCLEATQPDTFTGILHRHPLIWGQSGNEIAGYAFMVVRMTTAIVARKLLLGIDDVPDDVHSVGFFRETSTYYAKEQYGIKADYLIEPTMGRILDLIDQSENPDPRT